MSDPRDARIAELEAEIRELKMQALADVGQLQDAAERVGDLRAELAGWKRVAVEAAIPLEAMRMSGTDKHFSPTLREGVIHAVATIRRAVMGEGLPPPPPPIP